MIKILIFNILVTCCFFNIDASVDKSEKGAQKNILKKSIAKGVLFDATQRVVALNSLQRMLDIKKKPVRKPYDNFFGKYLGMAYVSSGSLPIDHIKNKLTELGYSDHKQIVRVKHLNEYIISALELMDEVVQREIKDKNLTEEEVAEICNKIALAIK